MVRENNGGANIYGVKQKSILENTEGPEKVKKG